MKGSWEETVEAYLRVWDQKSPQWLLMQYGQDEWEPKIKKMDIVREFNETFRRICYQEFEEGIARLFNNPALSGLPQQQILSANNLSSQEEFAIRSSARSRTNMSWADVTFAVVPIPGRKQTRLKAPTGEIGPSGKLRRFRSASANH